MGRASIKVVCSRCKGVGSLVLNGCYMDTLVALASHEPITGSGLAQEMGIAGNAMCNRLVALERLGLARGERYGRTRTWRIVRRRKEPNP